MVHLCGEAPTVPETARMRPGFREAAVTTLGRETAIQKVRDGRRMTDLSWIRSR